MMTDARPSISIVIPCFNYAHYVSSAIESALSQTYPNKQVVVVNDGSTDASLAVISRYTDRVELVDQPNQGSIAAYNRGFLAASGDVVIFLDADDLLDREALSRVAEVWSPACAKVQYDLRIIDGTGTDLGRLFCNFDKSYDVVRAAESFRRTGTYRWPITVGNAYSRWFMQAIFPLEIEHGPDGTLNTVAPVYGDVVTIAEPLGSYRIHGDNMWSSDGSDPTRLPYRIRHRKAEEAFMRRHAAARGVPVPRASILDHELAFINYRLLAKKLSLSYEGSDGDTLRSLFWCACKALHEDGLPLRLRLGHLCWFSALSLLPGRAAARTLMRLRFNRSTILKAFERRVRRQLSGRGRVPLAPLAVNPTGLGDE